MNLFTVLLFFIKETLLMSLIHSPKKKQKVFLNKLNPNLKITPKNLSKHLLTKKNLSVCFKIFDMDRDGLLDSVELQHMIEILVFIAKENKPRADAKDEDFKKCRVEKISEGNNRYLDEVYVKLLEDLKGRLGDDGTLSQEDFLMWSVDDNPLVAPLLELLFEVCHVSLGLKPHCRHHEHEIGEFLIEGSSKNVEFMRNNKA